MTLNGNQEKKKSVLVVVAHPDDETFGAGGALAKFCNQGYSVYAISFTNGVGARESSAKDSITKRSKAAELAASELGFKWAFRGDFPDNALDTVSLLELVKIIEETKDAVKPSIIFTHSPSDLNVDHRVVATAALTAFRPVPNEIFTEILAMEIPSATDFGSSFFFGNFSPNYYINVESTWERKTKALEKYQDELRESPHSRSKSGIHALAVLRGHQVGIELAEAFQLIRKVERF